MFSQAFSSLGMRVADEKRNRQIDSLRMDGIAFAKRPKELRKPGSVFLAQSYLEAHAVAAMLVDLGRAEGVADVVRAKPPDPDVEVRYTEQGSLFVEQTMVMDAAATRLAVTIDDANIAAYDLGTEDPTLRALLRGGMFSIRLDRLREDCLEMPLSVDALADEILNVGRTIGGPVSCLEPDPTRSPLLYALGASIFYIPGNAQTARPIQLPIFHGRIRLLEPELRAALGKKKEKAAAYSDQCRPLWLLIDIDLNFDAGRRLRPIAERAMDEFEMSIYDRVVIQQVGYPPLVFDAA